MHLLFFCIGETNLIFKLKEPKVSIIAHNDITKNTRKNKVVLPFVAIVFVRFIDCTSVCHCMNTILLNYNSMVQ